MYDNSPPWAAKACFFLSLFILVGTVAALCFAWEGSLGDVVFAKVYLGVHGILGGLCGMTETIDAFDQGDDCDVTTPDQLEELK